tara:strand:+ start:503 stop:703 length:201 start_codon:yes stop_codon:yes gene_type:complete
MFFQFVPGVQKLSFFKPSVNFKGFDFARLCQIIKANNDRNWVFVVSLIKSIFFGSLCARVVGLEDP